MYSKEIIGEVQDASDLVHVVSQYVTLQQKSSLHWGLCPFHSENSPSFCVNNEKQFYYCHGCGAGGNVFNFLQSIGNFTFIEALKHLASEANIKLPEKAQSQESVALSHLKDRLIEIHKSAGLFYYGLLQSKEGTKARDYLESRGLNADTCRKFGLGYSSQNKEHSLLKHLQSQNFSISDILQSGLVSESKDRAGSYYDRFRDRLMFPIFNDAGKPVGFGGRIFDGNNAKYLNSPETPIFQKSNLLYGLNFAKQLRPKELILVEGYMDTISLYQGGFQNVVASLGTAFNEHHAKNLRRHVASVTILFDSDNAGTIAALRAIPVLVKSGLSVRVLQVKDGKDPDEFIKTYGSQAFEKLLHQSVHYISFQISSCKSKYNLDILEEKVSFVKEVAEILSNLDSEIERSVYLKEVSKLTDVDEQAIKDEMQKIVSVKQAKIDTSSKNDTRYNTRIELNKNANVSQGVLDAQRSILYFCFEDKTFYMAIKPYLTGEEFTIPIYKELYLYMANRYTSQNRITINEVNTHFVDNENLNYLAKIFAMQIPMNNNSDIEISLNEMVKKLKSTYISHKISEVDILADEIDSKIAEQRANGIEVSDEFTSIGILNTLINARKELEKINITLYSK